MKDNELITRRNIELALLNKGQHSRRYKLGDIWELNYDEIREVLDDVDANADVQPVRWIPVTKRLPEESGLYFVTEKNLGNLEACTRYFNVRGDESFWSGRRYTQVLAWMPLPEPWKEGET